MRKYIFSLLATLVWGLTASAQTSAYKILHECDTTLQIVLQDTLLASRDVHYIVYEYPSKDADGKAATISGIVLIPSDVKDGSVPCDGTILYNHFTLASPAQAPSQGDLLVPGVILANPLNPNYIVVASDYVGYGSSIDRRIAYLCGDTNARNSLDGLLAARKMLEDKNVPQGKYLFNMGYSQGGTESMYVAKLRDTEYKDKVTFTKTFVGGGLLDCEKAYSEYVNQDRCDDIMDVAMFLISANENLHLGIDYHNLFQEPLASHVQEVIDTKDKEVLAKYLGGLDYLHQLLQPNYLNLRSDQAKQLSAKLAEVKIANGWNPDLTQRYFIEHSRHDNFVPIQASRSLLTYLKEKGFESSIVPGKTNLQTNTAVIKFDHTLSGVVWAVQTMAAVQFWPVVYYEGEQNRYYYEAVHDLTLVKFVKYLESLGIDVRSLLNGSEGAKSLNVTAGEDAVESDESVSGSPVLRRANMLEFLAFLNKISDVLEKLDLTVWDVMEILDDSDISLEELIEAYDYLNSDPVETADEEVSPLIDKEAFTNILNTYEQKLNDWLKVAGYELDWDFLK